MKVAVCVSGAFKTGHPKGCLVKNNRVQKNKFPEADFYYATWNSYKSDFEKLFPDYQCEYFSEPVMHYHPYLDIKKQDYISTFYHGTVNWVREGGPKRIEWTLHHTKQILIHAWLIDIIKNDYDVIIRTRFDCLISKKANFGEFIKDTYNNNRANGFGTRKEEHFNHLREIDTKKSNWSVRLLDQLIIHAPSVIDCIVINGLHKDKILHAAEYGWYQTISMNHGSDHRNHDGWVNHDRKVPKGV